MKIKCFAAVLAVFLAFFFSASASVDAYVAPNLLFCKNPLTLRAGSVYVNGVASAETGIVEAQAGDELAFEFSVTNGNSVACQKPVTTVLAFYGSSKDYLKNWFSYSFEIKTSKQLKSLPDGFMKIKNQLPLQYSLQIAQGETVRAKLVVKTPADAKTTLLAFGVATAYLVPETSNETILNTTSTLDFKPIVFSTKPTTTPALAPTAMIATPTPALEQAINQVKPSQLNDWTLTAFIAFALAVTVFLFFAARFLTRPPASNDSRTLRERHGERERKRVQRAKR